MLITYSIKKRNIKITILCLSPELATLRVQAHFCCVPLFCFAVSVTLKHTRTHCYDSDKRDHQQQPPQLCIIIITTIDVHHQVPPVCPVRTFLLIIAATHGRVPAAQRPAGGASRVRHGRRLGGGADDVVVVAAVARPHHSRCAAGRTERAVHGTPSAGWRRRRRRLRSIGGGVRGGRGGRRGRKRTRTYPHSGNFRALFLSGCVVVVIVMLVVKKNKHSIMLFGY